MNPLLESIVSTSGIVAISEYGKNKFVDMGNYEVPLDLKPSEKKIEIPDNRTTGGGTAYSRSTVDTITFDAVFYNQSEDMIKKFLKANDLLQAAETKTETLELSKNYTSHIGKYSTLNTVLLQSDDSSIIEHVKHDQMGLYLSEDYPQETAAVIINYDIPEHKKLTLFTDANKEYTLLFETTNVADNNKKTYYKFHRVSLDVPGGFSIVTGVNENKKIPATMTLLSDPNNPDNPFVEIWDA